MVDSLVVAESLPSWPYTGGGMKVSHLRASITFKSVRCK
jgi:hypothetical protein